MYIPDIHSDKSDARPVFFSLSIVVCILSHPLYSHMMAEMGAARQVIDKSISDTHCNLSYLSCGHRFKHDKNRHFPTDIDSSNECTLITLFVSIAYSLDQLTYQRCSAKIFGTQLTAKSTLVPLEQMRQKCLMRITCRISDQIMIFSQCQSTKHCY